jgi:L-galactose dehydrogenase
MQTRLLGRTGLKISELSFGGAAVGQQYGNVTDHEVADTLNCAAEAGINFIDTSAFYGQGRSEEIFGSLLTPELRSHFLIGTKAGRWDRDRFDFSAKGMRDCFEGSLRRLKTDQVDVLLAHDIEFAEDLEQVFTETAHVLHDLKREGKCRFIGMSGLPLSILTQAVERCNLDVVVSYCHYTLFDQTLRTDFLPLCERLGVGVLNASPLSMGLLTPGGPPPWHPADEEIKSFCKAAAEYCRMNGADISEHGMQYCLSEPRIASTITGTARRSELERNLKAIGQRPDPVLLKAIQALFAPIQNRSWPSGRVTI